MKAVTQERILKAHKRYLQLYHNSSFTKIIHALATNGFQSLTNTTTELYDQKLKLELSLLGAFDINRVRRKLKQAGISEAEVLQEMSVRPGFECEEAFCLAGWICLFDSTYAHCRGHRDAIRRIQTKNNVSGLVNETIDFGHSILTFKEENDLLTLIDSDYNILSHQRFELAEAFIRAVEFNGMTLYQHFDTSDMYGEWRESTADVVLACVAEAQTADCWSELYFTNHKEMKTQGYTTPRAMPISPDHEREWSIYLSCRDFPVDGHRMSPTGYFCAYLGSGTPCV